MAVAGPHGGIGLAVDDVAQDRDACDAGDIADHVVDLEVHQHHRLLHARNVGGGGFDELVAMTDQAAQRRDRGVGPEASPQQSNVCSC
jgi:hypothetical protein